MGLATLPADAEAYVEGSPANRLVQTVLMIAAIAVLLRRKQAGAVLRSNPLLVMFFAYAGLSFLWSDYAGITFRRWFKSVGDPLMVLVVLTDTNPGAAIKRLLITVGFLVIPPSVWAIKYYPAIGRTYNRWTWSMMVTGVTTHKNTLGMICQIYGVVFFWGLMNAWRSALPEERRREVVAFGIALVMVIWLFWQAGSVTAQSCFMLACLFLLATGGGAARQERQLLHALVPTLIVVPSAVLFLGIGTSALTAMGRSSTLTGRPEIWHRALALSGNPLLGSGFESFWLGKRLETLQDWYPGLNSTHNGYLEIFVTLGWIGVALLVGLIITGYRNIIAAQEHNSKRAALSMAYFIAVTVESFTEAAFRPGGVIWIIFLLVTTRQPAVGAAGVSVRGLKRRATHEAVRPLRRRDSSQSTTGHAHAWRTLREERPQRSGKDARR